MSIPALPPAGSTNWYSHYSALDQSARSPMGTYRVSEYGTIDGTNDEAVINAAIADMPSTGGRLWLDSPEYVCHAPIVPKSHVLFTGHHIPRYHVSANPTSATKIRVGSGFQGEGLIVPPGDCRAVGFENVALVGDGVTGSGGAPIHGIRMPDFADVVGEQSWRLKTVTIAGFSGSGITGRLHVWTIDDAYIHSNRRYGTECSPGTDHFWSDVKVTNSFVFFNRMGGMYWNGDNMTGYVNVINSRFERSGQVFGDPENDAGSADWVDDASGVRVGHGQFIFLTNCSTDANTGPGYDFDGPAGRVNNCFVTSCFAMRDGGGDQSSSAADTGGFRVRGATSAGGPQYIQFLNCGAREGYSDDSPSGTAPITPAYGLWYENSLQLLWNGREPGGEVGPFNAVGDCWGSGLTFVNDSGDLMYIKAAGSENRLNP